MPDELSRRRFVAGTAAAGAAAAGFRTPAVLRASDAAWGDLVGRFVYGGPVPERRKLTVDKDVDCCGKFDIRDESLMVGPDGGLANVYVYLHTRRVQVCPELEASTPKQVKLDNLDCIFQPHCMAIWCEKQTFYIVNSDPIAQNVAYSPLGDVPVNVVLSPAPGANVSATCRFAREQNVPVAIACNYHPWESAYILPRSNPYLAISAADGTFRIAKLPVGRLEFRAWQERIKFVATPQWPKGRFEVVIRPGVNDLGKIKLPPEKFAV